MSTPTMTYDDARHAVAAGTPPEAAAAAVVADAHTRRAAVVPRR